MHSRGGVILSCFYFVKFYFALALSIAFVGASAQATPVPCADVAELEQSLALAIVPQVRATVPAFLKVANTCSVQLRDWVKEPIRRLTDREHAVDGLNCWGSVLHLRGLRESAFYAHDREFTYVMDHACRKLGSIEQLKPGDVGAIRKQIPGRPGAFEEIHAYIFLNSEFAISKHSYSYAAPLEVTESEKFYSVYGGPGTFTDYYRCGDWVSDDPFKVLPAVRQLAIVLEGDYLMGRALGRDPAVDTFYLPLIERLNKIFFAPGAADHGYAFRLFESAVWQYTYLLTGERTDSENLILLAPRPHRSNNNVQGVGI